MSAWLSERKSTYIMHFTLHACTLHKSLGARTYNCSGHCAVCARRFLANTYRSHLASPPPPPPPPPTTVGCCHLCQAITQDKSLSPHSFLCTTSGRWRICQPHTGRPPKSCAVRTPLGVNPCVSKVILTIPSPGELRLPNVMHC